MDEFKSLDRCIGGLHRIKNPTANSGVFFLRTMRVDNPSAASDMFYLDFAHTYQPPVHPHAYQPYLQTNHHSKIPRPTVSS